MFLLRSLVLWMSARTWMGGNKSLAVVTGTQERFVFPELQGVE